LSTSTTLTQHLSAPGVTLGSDEELAGPPRTVNPIQRRERISSMDILRGFALLGILVVNMDDFSGPESLHDIPLGVAKAAFLGPHAHLNLVCLFLKWIFIESKMRGLFSMLFGAGVVLLTARAEKRGAGSQMADIYLRRNMWLVALGVLHGTFLWHGDILFLYGFCGLMFLYPCRKLKARTLFLAGNVMLAVVTVAYLHHLSAFDDFSLSHKVAAISADQHAGRQLTPEQRQVQEQWKAEVAHHVIDPKKVQAEVSDAHKGYLSDLTQDGLDYVAHMAHILGAGAFFEELGAMLIGMALFKSGFLSAELAFGTYLKIAIIGFSISVPLYVAGMWKAYASGFYFLTLYKWIYLPYFFTEETGAIAIAAVLLMIIKSGAVRTALRPFAAVGQTALGNYLLTSLLCQLIFRWGACKLYGQLEYYQLNYVVVAIWAINLVVSPLWLCAFEFGPVEWLWRSLTSWKLQPMRLRS
jgi:uncharacterized protein